MILNDINRKIRYNERIENSMLYDVIFRFIKYFELDNYLKHFEIIDTDMGECFGYYSPEEKSIKISNRISMSQILMNHANNSYTRNIYENKNSIYTTEMLRRTYHELMHVLQHRIVKERKLTLNEKIFREDLCLKSNDEYFHKYYDCSTELNAEFVAIMQTLDIVRYNSLGIVDFNFRCHESSYYLYKELINIIIKFYSFSSPVERSNIDIDENEYANLSNYERMSLGLPINQGYKRKVLNMDPLQFKNLRNI